MVADVDIQPHAVAPGVYQCRWRGSRDAVLVDVAVAPPCWRQIGDILVGSARADIAAAVAAARALAEEYPGCAVVAVPVGGHAVVVIR